MAEVEGWMAEKASSTPRYHYILGSRSLCGRFGFYFGPTSEATPGVPKGPKDCAECYKRLGKREESRGR